MINAITDISQAIVNYLKSKGYNAASLGFQDNVMIDSATDYVINVIVHQVKSKFTVYNRGFITLNISVPDLSSGEANLYKINQLATEIIKNLPDKIDNIILQKDKIEQNFYREKNYSFLSLRIYFNQT